MRGMMRVYAEHEKTWGKGQVSAAGVENELGQLGSHGAIGIAARALHSLSPAPSSIVFAIFQVLDV
jgi:hypothetical protein